MTSSSLASGTRVSIPSNLTKLKQFFWDVKDNRTVGRGIGGYYTNDTTAATTTSGTAVTLKTYTFTSGPNTNYIRIRVYGYVSAGTGNYAIVINGTSVATGTTTSTTATLVIEYFGSLTPNTSYTININAYNSVAGDTTAVSQVSINAGFGLTSTTSTNILTVTLGTNDTYTLNVTGNFVYTLGIRWWAKGNRKTTATATIQSNLANEAQGYAYVPVANNDTDNNVILTVRTGNYATSFTISGNVGASGDVIIITEIYAQICLRGNNADSFNAAIYWSLIIKEKGIMVVSSYWATIDQSSTNASYWIANSNLPNKFVPAYQAAPASAAWVTNLIFSANDSPEVIWMSGTDSDTNGASLWLYVNIIIIGM